MEYKNLYPASLGVLKERHLKDAMTVISVSFLSLLFVKYALAKSGMILDITFSMLIIVLFYNLYERMHQDWVSYFFLLFALVLHSLGLYDTSPLGIRFDHYMHFVGGFAIAIIADRLLNSNIGRVERFVFIFCFAIGIVCPTIFS